jgi:hypothetical protein
MPIESRVKLCVSCDPRVIYILHKYGLKIYGFSSTPNFRTLQKLMHSVCVILLEDIENDLRVLKVEVEAKGK